jgi:catechol 2,3-dioxygenase-like lactoylglutathione lyase family enzyme
MRQSDIGSQFISCAAVLVVADISRSVGFYRDRLGFDVAEIWGDPPSFAIADSPRASIMLKQSIQSDDPNIAAPNAARVGGLWDAYIWVRDLKPVLAHLAATETAHTEPEEMPHGCTEIIVTDPDGYLICFGYCP